jgi:hypothetical protein
MRFGIWIVALAALAGCASAPTVDPTTAMRRAAVDFNIREISSADRAGVIELEGWIELYPMEGTIWPGTQPYFPPEFWLYPTRNTGPPPPVVVYVDPKEPRQMKEQPPPYDRASIHGAVDTSSPHFRSGEMNWWSHPWRNTVNRKRVRVLATYAAPAPDKRGPNGTPAKGLTDHDKRGFVIRALNVTPVE